MRYVLLLSLFFFSFISNVSAAPPEKIIFFGDSLTDNGNLYRLDMHLLPKSPPYFAGRFSNGPTWAEIIAWDYHHQFGVTSENYAWGGATTVTHSTLHEHTFPVTLAVELDRYLLDTLFRNKSDTLFSFWIGGNDYLFDKETDVDLLTTKVVSEIMRGINKLIQFHARHFLVMTLPNLGKIPAAHDKDENPQRLNDLTVAHNHKLAEAVVALRKAHPEITVAYVDIGFFFNELLEDPQKYNRMRNVNITNTTDPCWQGGYRLRYLAEDRALQTDNPSTLTDMALTLPDLREARQTARLAAAGFTACASPDQYVFWDGIHPSAVAHRMIASRVESELHEVGF